MSDLERINNLTNISHSNQAVKSRQKENDLDFAKREPDYTKNTDLYSLFREQKNQFPDKNALVYHEESWTYEQLDWKAQKLAQTLVEQGITKNDVVAILVGHKVEQIVSILSIVKIGAIYLPIDPEYPVDRIEFMVEHAKAKAIIIDQDEEHVKYHATIPSIHCLRVEKNTYTLSDMKDDYSITKESPAYIMYTSGTTGKPKGILIRQKGIIRLVKNPNYIKILTTDRFLQTSTFVFDASTFEIWGALLNGATLYLSDKEEILDPVLLKERIHKNQITTMWMTAPLFNQLIELDPTLFRTLHYLIVGGDTLSEKHIQRLFDYHSNLKVINGYGPTENTTFSITYEISSPPKGIIPIGKPINNTEVYILDEEKRPVAPGEEGEICLGGDGLAVGYINNVSLTNEKFIDHPFKVGEKLYCTGDWGRVRGDGNIEFLERKDRQFKINGYRVELKEIETIAKKNEAITDAVITVKEEGNKKHLTLYYISESLDRKQMLDYLNYVLPRYMVPSQIIQLNQFPLNDRGKIDMQKLREKTEILDTLTERVDQDAFKNGSRLENEIIDMVSRVGNQSEKISMESNLFEMGFDSLKIALLINEINKKYQKQISLREIFSHPTVKKIVELIGYKRSERLEQIVKKPTTKTKYPASSAQKRVFLASKFSEVGTNYNIPLILKLEGELNKSFLLEAINKVLDRHEALRTNFLYQDKQIYQIIHENVTLEMKERIGEESKIEQLIKENLTQFDLEKDILVNVTLICVRDHVHYLLMDMHHIVIDGYSVNLLINELFSLYEGKAIHDVEYQYKDISELQQKYLKSDNFKKHESYWLQYLTQQKESRWLSSYPIQKKANHEPIGKEIEWVLDGNIVKQMKEYLRKNEYTEMMFLFTCFYVSIMKLTSNNEQRIGVPFSGRNRMEYKDVIGMLVNVMPVYLNVEENNTFEDLLQQTKNVLLDAIENQNYPFEMLVEKLNNGRKANENPLFDITFDVQHDDSSGFYIQNNQMEVKPCTIDFSISKFSISMAALISEGQIRFKLQYRMNEWMENQVNKIKYTLNKFIEMGLTNPSTPIKEWFSITTKGLDIQMEEINRTSVDYPKEKNLYYLFQEQMNHNSQKKILVYHSKSWTYEQLDWKVRQLSQALIEQGASKHDVIGILIGNKVEQIVSMLAIVKIGAIYLPIDPNYPEERIHYILEDAKAKFLIIDEEIEHLKDSQDMVIVNCNDSREFEINELSDTSDESITGETPAYIMYTSGTTGKPKGILIRQKGIIRLVKNTNYIDILPTDRLLQTSTFVFDASTFEIWGALLNGAALYLSDKKEILDSAVLREKISVNQITIMWLTAPLFNQLVKQDPTLFKPLTYLLIGGDALSEKHVALLMENNPNVRIINGYGPTENTTFSITYEIETYPKGTIPIGKPINNTTVYILNEEKNPVPMGEEGEIHLGGDGLAIGYINNEVLTKEKFIDHPYKQGEKLYCTGDWGRIRPDGNIEFLGRKDRQYKINGYRIELKEIEAIAQAKDEVKDAIVIVKEVKGKKKLVLYYISESIDRRQMRDYLHHVLPTYMIPSQLIQLDHFPLNDRGKIDMNQLKQYKDGKDEQKNMSMNTESDLYLLWKRVLDSDDFGLEDDFFSCGGNSLLLLEVYQNLKEKYGKNIKISDLFTHSTIKGLAKFLNNLADQSVVNKLMITLKKDMFLEYPKQSINFKSIEFWIDENSYQELNSHYRGMEFSTVITAFYIFLLDMMKDSGSINLFYMERNHPYYLKDIQVPFIPKTEQIIEFTKEVQKMKSNNDQKVDENLLAAFGNDTFNHRQIRTIVTKDEKQIINLTQYYHLILVISEDERDPVIRLYYDSHKFKLEKIGNIMTGLRNLTSAIAQEN